MQKLRSTTAGVFSLLAFLLTLEAWANSKIVGWGLNLAGQVTGVPSIGYSTNKLELGREVASANLYVTGIVTIARRELTNAVAIASGDSHGLALDNEGNVYGWGWNVFGQAIGAPTISGLRVTNGPAAVSDHILTNATSIAAGRTHSAALRTDGTVVIWGALNSGRTISVPSGLSNVVAVAAGWDGSLALRRDGTVVGWDMPVPAGLSNIVAVAASIAWEGKNFALRSDGTVVQWHNRNIAAEILVGVTNTVAIAAGPHHNLALQQSGLVLSWSDGVAIPVVINGHPLTNAVAISAGDGFSAAIREDSTVVAWGQMNYQPVIVPEGLSNVIALAAGESFCLAITTNSEVAERLRQK